MPRAAKVNKYANVSFPASNAAIVTIDANTYVTAVTTRFIMAEFVREKVLELTHDEIPHTVTCYVENYEEDDKVVHIQVLIVVDRDNIKKIIIGKQGSMLKEIGTRARYDMEKFLGKKVFLETYVKTLKNWRDQEKYFVELGLKDEDE